MGAGGGSILLVLQLLELHRQILAYSSRRLYFLNTYVAGKDWNVLLVKKNYLRVICFYLWKCIGSEYLLGITPLNTFQIGTN